MQYDAKTPAEYIKLIPDDRKGPIKKLRKVILDNLPKGFKEEISYGMIRYVIPHSMYPDGYHCNPELPLPFMSLASQKNFIAVYHSGVYADKKLSNWFTKEYEKYSKLKLDMGKSCIRFKKIDQIPYDLIGELSSKVTPEEYIEMYEKAIKKK